MRIIKIIGPPTSPKIPLIGNVISPIKLDTNSLASAIIAPSKATLGIRTKWLEVFKKLRAKWGEIIPMKAIGPQKDVTVPDKIAVINKSIFLEYSVILNLDEILRKTEQTIDPLQPAEVETIFSDNQSRKQKLEFFWGGGWESLPSFIFFYTFI